MQRQSQLDFPYFAEQLMPKASSMKKNVSNQKKAVTAEGGKTKTWLAEEIGNNRLAASRLCTNQIQPTLDRLPKNEVVFDNDARELLVSTKNHKQ